MKEKVSESFKVTQRQGLNIAHDWNYVELTNKEKMNNWDTQDINVQNQQDYYWWQEMILTFINWHGKYLSDDKDSINDLKIYLIK